jgi:hypothetical protein
MTYVSSFNNLIMQGQTRDTNLDAPIQVITVPEHDGGAEGESREADEVGEGEPVESVPRAGAVPHEDVGELAEHDEPPGRVERDGESDEPHPHGPHEEPAERDVERQPGGGDGRHGHDLALRLQELLDGEVEGVGEELRDHVEREPPREGGDVGVLVEEAQDRGGKEVEREHEHGHAGEDDPRALQVHAQHVQLLRAVRLPAQRLQRAPHAQLHATHAPSPSMLHRSALSVSSKISFRVTEKNLIQELKFQVFIIMFPEKKI